MPNSVLPEKTGVVADGGGSVTLGDPGIVDDDALDGARGGDGLDARLLTRVEKLGQLVGVPCLGTGGAIDTAQRRDDVAGDGLE
jgi:hypothetical protein